MEEGEVVLEKKEKRKAIRRMVSEKFCEISDSIEKQKEKWSSSKDALQMGC